MSTEISQKVSTSQKFIYAFGSLGQGLFSGLFSASILKFYTDVIGLDASRITLAFMVYAIWNAINDPIFGFLSDKIKWKRATWLKASNPLITLFFALCWFSPIGDSWWGFAYLLVMLIGYDTFYTIIGLNIGAILPEMSQSTYERSKVQIVSALFGVIAALLSIGVPSLILTGTINLAVFRSVMIIIAIISFVVSQICAYKVDERFVGQKEETLGIIESIKLAFKNRSFIALVLANFTLIFFSSTATNALLYFTEYVLGLTGTQIIFPVLFIFIGVIVGAMMIMKWVKIRGLKTAMFRGILITSIGLILIPFMPGISIYIPLLAVGFGIVGPALLFNIIIGDISDEDELITNNRREGIFFGVNALVTKPAQSLAASFIAYMLLWFEYRPPIEESEGVFISQVQDPIAILGIKLLFGFIPGIFMLFGVFIFRYYDLDGEKIRLIKEKIVQLHKSRQVSKII